MDNFEPKENPVYSLNSKICFGMYRGKTVRNILYKENLYYFKWLLDSIEWFKPDEELRKEIEKDYIVDFKHKLPFGKYKDKNIKYIIDNDIQYCRWFYEYLCDIFKVYFNEETLVYYEEKLNENKEEIEVSKLNKFNKEFSGFY